MNNNLNPYLNNNNNLLSPMNNNNILVPPMNNNINPMNNNNNNMINNDGMNNNMITNTISSSFHPYVNMGNNMMNSMSCQNNPYLRERPLMNYISFLEGTIISIFQKLNQSSSSIDFPSIFKDIIPELERRVNDSQIFPFIGCGGIYGMLDSMLRPNWELNNAMMKSFLERIKVIAVETENDSIVKKIKKRLVHI